MIVVLPLLVSWVALPALLQPPSPSGKAQAQAWFARVLETSLGGEYFNKHRPPTLEIVAESYTVYLDPKVYDVEYVSTVSESEYGLTYYKLKYDLVILGSGMFNRFYKNPDVYADQVRLYDKFFEAVPDMLAFEKGYDPLEFREDGTDVYVFFLSDQAKKLLSEVQETQ